MLETYPQVKALMLSEGKSAEEACSALGLDEAETAGAVTMAKSGTSAYVMAMIEASKPMAVKVIVDLAQFSQDETTQLRAAEMLLKQEIHGERGSAEIERFSEARARIVEIEAEENEAAVRKDIVVAPPATVVGHH